MRRLPQKSRKLQRRRCRRRRLPKKRRRMKPCPRRRIRTPEAEVEVTDPELAEILSRAQVLLDSSAGEAPASTPAVPAQPEQTPAPTEQVSPPQEAPEAPAEQTQEAGEPAPRRSVKGLIIFLSVLLVLAALAVGAYYYYIRYYCVPIQQLEVVNGTLDSFQIRLATDADPSLLHPHLPGYLWQHLRSAPVRRDCHLYGLSPNTQYTVTSIHRRLSQAHRSGAGHLRNRSRNQDCKFHRRHRSGRTARSS